MLGFSIDCSNKGSEDIFLGHSKLYSLLVYFDVVINKNLEGLEEILIELGLIFIEHESISKDSSALVNPKLGNLQGVFAVIVFVGHHNTFSDLRELSQVKLVMEFLGGRIEEGVSGHALIEFDGGVDYSLGNFREGFSEGLEVSVQNRSVNLRYDQVVWHWEAEDAEVSLKSYLNCETSSLWIETATEVYILQLVVFLKLVSIVHDIVIYDLTNESNR